MVSDADQTGKGWAHISQGSKSWQVWRQQNASCIRKIQWNSRDSTKMSRFCIQNNQCLDSQKQTTQAARYWDWGACFFPPGRQKWPQGESQFQDGQGHHLIRQQDNATWWCFQRLDRGTQEVLTWGRKERLETAANVNDQMVGFDVRYFSSR